MNNQATNIQPGAAFDLAATHFSCPVNIAPSDHKAHWTYHNVRRPSRAELLQRELDSTTKTKPKGGGRSLIIINSDEADEALYDLIAETVGGYTADGMNVAVTSDLLKRISGGHKRAAINFLYSGHAKVEWKPEMAFFDYDASKPLRVIHEFGTREEPEYTIFWQMRRPDVLEKADYRLNSTQIYTGGGGRRAQSELVSNLEVSIRLFNRLFAGVEGAVLNGEAYTDAMRDEFLAAIDPVVMSQVITAIMDAEDGSSQD